MIGESDGVSHYLLIVGSSVLEVEPHEDDMTAPHGLVDNNSIVSGVIINRISAICIGDCKCVELRGPPVLDTPTQCITECVTVHLREGCTWILAQNWC